MARIFNIHFLYDHAQYHAFVSVRHTPFYTEYILSSFDEELMPLLPGNRIISMHDDHFVFQNAGNNNNNLMNTIIRAVAEHVHATNA
jgi:hypothetical protein